MLEVTDNSRVTITGKELVHEASELGDWSPFPLTNSRSAGDNEKKDAF